MIILDLDNCISDDGWRLPHISCATLKHTLLKRLIRTTPIGLKDIHTAYDDRQDVIEMYWAMGIPAKRVWINEREANDDSNRAVNAL